MNLTFIGQTYTVFGFPISAELLVVLILVIFVTGSRIIRALLVHQQRMAEIMKPNPVLSQGVQEYQAMRQELDSVKAALDRQANVLDSIVSQQRQLAESLKPADQVSQRLRAE